jgi:hypothetical protein
VFLCTVELLSTLSLGEHHALSIELESTTRHDFFYRRIAKMKRTSLFVALTILVAVFISLTATSIRAQSASSGGVTGQVSDPQGAIVTGAEVTLTDTATRSALTTTTNDAGRYNFPVVHPGLYDLVVTKSGFKTAKFSGQKVSIGAVLTLNVSLEVGALTETVVVTAGAAGTELQTANATVGTTISLKELELLPNLGRDATTLMALQPGVTPSGQVAGAVGDQNSFSIDGGQNSDDMSGDQVGYTVNFTGTSPTNGGNQINGMASGVAPTPIESVEEFRVNTFGQTADFNGSIGAQVQMVTRRGSDQWHGSGYGYYWTPNILGANSWKANHTSFTKGSPSTPRPCAPGTTLHKGDDNCIMPYTPIIPNQRKRFGFTIGGTLIPWEVLGGKTYIFANYEGFRFGGVQTFERAYPSAAMRAGVIQVPDAAGVWQPYNLNPFPVTVTIGNPNSTTSPLRTVTVAPCVLSSGAFCDPRANAANATPNPLITQVWNTIPLPNDPLFSQAGADRFNTQGYLSTIRLPLTSDVAVGRIDHNFGQNHRFFTSFRAQHLERTVNSQVDVGGLLPGTTRGQYASTAVRVQTPELLVFGLTSTLSPTLTNDLRLSYLWNWWGWGTSGIPPQFPGLGGAIEIARPGDTDAETSGANALIPYNVNTQSVRQRTWDGKDYMIRDDVSWVHGNHLFQFGGFFQPNVDYFSRTDNGTTVSNQIVYQIARKSISFTNLFPSTLPTSTSARNSYGNLASAVLGLVGFTQVLYTREGADLAIQPLGKQSQVRSTIRTYNAYINDTWRMSPTLTLSLGVGYTVEMPPVEQQGRQVVLVDLNGKPIKAAEFLAARKAAALNGQAYAPVVGFETARNLNLKYPYEPFYGGISPKVSIAWNPQFKSGWLHTLFGEGSTVFRAGYGRQYGRLNGVNNLLVPMSGPGLLQSVTCALASRTGCLTSGTVTPNNVFRIGIDGLTAPLPGATGTLPQPFFPGALQTGTTAVPCPPGSLLCNPLGADSRAVDFAYRPESTDNFDFTIQRSFGRNIAIELGYMRRKIDHEFAEVDLDSVPYMMTLGGQAFSDAYAKLYVAICGLGPSCANNAYTGPPQPFFEAALTPGTGYCATFASCTAAVASKEASNFANVQVSSLWANLNSGVGWKLGRTMLSDQATTIGLKTALGYGNYNAAFFTLRVRDWHGITAVSNFTWGRALGLGANTQRSSGTNFVDVYNLKGNYGPNDFDYKFLYNLGITYRPDVFKGKKGILGHLLNGWSISPFFAAQSGAPTRINWSGVTGCGSDCQAFGQTGNPNGGAQGPESAIPIGPFNIRSTANRGVTGSNGIGTDNPEGINMFADPAAVFAMFRRCVLGLDTNCGGGVGNLRGLPRWNIDATLGKEFKITERVGLQFTMQVTNVFNHFQPNDPRDNDANNLRLNQPQAFGRITNAVYDPRQVEWGMRVHF